jgi:hypothetical protein
MAKVLNPLMSTEVSGKMLAMVFQNWRGSNIVRQLTAPAQPRTARQLKVRAVLTEISKYFANILNDGLRIAWKNFVWRWTDLWGKEVRLTGINLFQKFNFCLRDSGRAMQVTTPPLKIVPEVNATMSEEEGIGDIIFDKITAGEIASQHPFLDIWFAGKVTKNETTGYDVGGTTTLWSDGLPQGVNPVKSNFTHLVYRGDVADSFTDVVIRNSAGVPFVEKRKLVFLARRYNINGHYSAVKKFEMITAGV